MTQHEENGTTERLRRTNGWRQGASRAGCACAQQPLEGRLQLDCDRRDPDRPRGHGRWLIARRVLDPGSDTQKAVDLIEAEFASEQGAVLNIVLAAPGGAARHPRARAAIDKAIATPEVDEFKPDKTTRQGGLTSVDNPFRKATFSKDGRIAYAERSSSRRSRTTTGHRCRGRGRRASDRRARRRDGGVQRRGRVPTARAGHLELLGLLAAIVVLLVVFRTFVAMLIPIAFAIVALMTAFLFLFILAGADRHQHGHADPRSMIGLGVGIDYSLFIVTRFRQLLHEGLDHAMQPPRPALGRPRRAVRRPDGRDLGQGPRVLRARLRNEARDRRALGVLTTVLIANSLLLAVLGLLGHKIDRLKVPFLPPIDDSEAAREKTLVARWGRFVTAKRTKVVFSRRPHLSPRPRRRRPRSSASAPPTRERSRKKQTSRRAYDLLAEGFCEPGFNGPIPIVVDINGDKAGAGQDLRGRSGEFRTWRR